MKPISRSLLYELKKAALPARYGEVSEWAMRRFGFRVVTARGLGRENALRMASGVLAEEDVMGRPGTPYFDMMEDLGRWWSREASVTALYRDEPIGFLTVLASPRSGETRLSCIQVRRAWQNRAVTAALVCEALRHIAAQSVQIGVIREDNLPSRYGAENTGARLIQCFECYCCEK